MMRARTCEHEAAVRNMVRSGQDDPALREHVARCAACRETADVAAWMAQLAAFPADEARLPDPGQLWWKARLLQRWDAQRRASRPIETGQRVHVGVAVAGCVALAVWLWPYLQGWGSRVVTTDLARVAATPNLLLAALAVGGLVAAATALVTLREIFSE